MAKAKAKGKVNNSKSKSGNKKPQKNTRKKESSIVKVTKTERVFKQKTRNIPSHLDLSKEKDDFKHVVRISNRDIPGYMSIGNGLELIYGISNRLGKAIEVIFYKKTNQESLKIGYLKENDIEVLNDIILNLDKEVPSWLLNRAKTIDGDGKKHLIMADLKLELRKNLQRLGKIKSYRGLRLQWGLPVRGQKTKSTFRNGGVVGVSKKK
ncbi:MAG: 30S ribosomal protein S13 [Candidatus ainarchaeum sp.]|nr:30S ribosomal protein S13 [Candidatus ainarchaeum sp.]MDD3975773.1 30S ribosomal protein S13 [Candidatus ainarchaeum sp.]